MSQPNSIDYANKRNTEYIIDVVSANALKLQQLEAMISGLTEAMRPLLEEWSALKKINNKDGI